MAKKRTKTKAKEPIKIWVKPLKNGNKAIYLRIIVNQNVTVNTFSSLVHTARHTMRVYNTRSRWLN